MAERRTLDRCHMPYDRGRILNALFHDTQEPVVVAGLDRTLLDVNPAFERVFGYSRDFIIGRSGVDLYGDERSIDSVQEQFVSVADAVSSKVLWLTFKRADGKLINARSTLIAIRNDAGAVQAYAGVIHVLPIEVQKFFDEGVSLGDLMTELKFHKALYSETPTMMHSIDEEGLIRHVSDAWLDRFGYQRHEVVGRRSVEFLTEASQEFAKQVLPEFWSTGRCERVPYTFLTRIGQPVEIELSATMTVIDGTRSTLAILEDVTDRNRAIRLLEERNEELREFAHVASHDLQAPLRHISIFSKLIEDDLDKGDVEAARENALLIQDSTNRLRGMVQALLDFSLTAENRFTVSETDLNDVLNEVLREVQTQIKNADATITTDRLPTLPCSGTLIERVFSNLLDNALKYVADGIAPKIQISVESQPGGLVVAFADNGIGIPTEFQDRIFQPLKRLHGPDSHYPGFGIGLSLCRKIVEAHHGRIWVEPNAQGGSTFFIQLPDPPLVMEDDLDPAFEEAVGY